MGTMTLTEVAGTVAKANNKGFTLTAAPDGWLNISKFAPSGVTVPGVGAAVKAGLDTSGFVRSIEVVTEAPAGVVVGAGGGAGREDRITRMGCLNTAVNILGSQGPVDAEAAIALAGQLEAWVTR